MAEKVFLTKEGKEELEKRLDYLRVVKRAEVTEKIKVARDFGDLSENFEYHAAKEEQGIVEGEILEIEAKLKYAVIIEEKDRKTGTVSLGSKVTISINDQPDEVCEIVGTTEADVFNGKISNESPIGNGLLGKKAGNTVTVTTPNGTIKVKIKSVS